MAAHLEQVARERWRDGVVARGASTQVDGMHEVKVVEAKGMADGSLGVCDSIVYCSQ